MSLLGPAGGASATWPTPPAEGASGGRRGVNVHTMYVRRDAPEGGLRGEGGGNRPNSKEMVPNSKESNSLQLSL